MEDAKVWRSRPLDALYPIVYLDCIHVKVGDGGVVRAKAMYLALASSARSRAQAPSLTPDALPAVTLQAGRTAPLSLASASELVSSGCSSLMTTTETALS